MVFSHKKSAHEHSEDIEMMVLLTPFNGVIGGRQILLGPSGRYKLMTPHQVYLSCQAPGETLVKWVLDIVKHIRLHITKKLE